MSLPIAIKKKAKISKTIIGCITKMKTAIFRVTLSFVPRFPVDNIPLNKKKAKLAGDTASAFLSPSL